MRHLLPAADAQDANEGGYASRDQIRLCTKEEDCGTRAVWQYRHRALFYGFSCRFLGQFLLLLFRYVFYALLFLFRCCSDLLFLFR